ncbi:MAG: WYL domain-containing protein [Chloroflexi bacterium]|nr:WYL domain-containing protein [Chloroflexota bacterium]
MDQDVAEEARHQILEARDASEVKAVQAAAAERAVAVELNVSRVLATVKQAIEQKRKMYLRYKPDPDAKVEAYQVAPLDIKPGKTPATRANDYLWAYSYEREHVVSLRLGRVLGAELSEEAFDPTQLMPDWRNKEPEWNVMRDW